MSKIIAKASDTLDWFGTYFGRDGFRGNICELDQTVTSSTFSILVNGSPTSVYYLTKGLRQDDPLSLFLFTLVMEHLSQSLKDKEESGELKTCKLGGAKVKSHIIYADDVMVFSKTTKESINSMMTCFTELQKYNGLQISQHNLISLCPRVADTKTDLLGLHPSKQGLSLADILDCFSIQSPSLTGTA